MAAAPSVSIRIDQESSGGSVSSDGGVACVEHTRWAGDQDGGREGGELPISLCTPSTTATSSTGHGLAAPTREAASRPETVSSPSKQSQFGVGHGDAHTTWVDSVLAAGSTVYIPSLFFGLADGAIISTVPLLSRGMGSSDKVVGVTAAASLIGKLIMDIPAGQVHELLGGGAAMTLGLVGVCISATMAYACRSPLLLFIALVLTGCSEALFSVSRGSVVRTAVPVRHRGRAVAMLGGINRMARAIGPAVGAWCSFRFGLWSTMLLRAVLAGVGAVALHYQLVVTGSSDPLSTLRPFGNVGGGGKAATSASTAHGSCMAAVNSIMSTVRANQTSIVTGGVVAFTLALIRQARNIVLSLKGDNVGLTSESIGIAFSLGYACDSLLFIPVGWVMDTHGRKTCGVPAFFVLSIGLLLIPMVTSEHGLVLVSIWLALGNGLSSGLLMTIGTDLAPRAFAGQFIGVWHLICDGGALCGPLLLGILSDASSLDTSAMICAGIGVFGGTWFLLCLPETLGART